MAKFPVRLNSDLLSRRGIYLRDKVYKVNVDEWNSTGPVAHVSLYHDDGKALLLSKLDLEVLTPDEIVKWRNGQ